MKRIVGLIALAALGWVLARKLLSREAEEIRPAGGITPAPAAEEASYDGIADLSGASKAELYEQAKRLQIEGRSKMSKEELARAVSRARNG